MLNQNLFRAWSPLYIRNLRHCNVIHPLLVTSLWKIINQTLWRFPALRPAKWRSSFPRRCSNRPHVTSPGHIGYADLCVALLLTSQLSLFPALRLQFLLNALRCLASGVTKWVDTQCFWFSPSYWINVTNGVNLIKRIPPG